MKEILVPTIIVLGAYFLVAFFAVKLTKEQKTADLFYGAPAVVLGLYFYYFVVAGPTPLYFVLSVFHILWGGRLVLLVKGRLKKERRGFKRSPVKSASLVSELLFRTVTIVFLLTPLVVGYLFRTSAAHIGDLDPLPLAGLIAGSALFCAGFVIEAFADGQMAVFQRRPENHRRILKRGLWRYSRHPNYFGELLLWIGIVVIVTTNSVPHGVVSLSALLATSVTIRRLMKSPPSARMEREAYVRYASKTAQFFPRPPKKI